MKCTERERETCEKEKLGCIGCAYYDEEKKNKDILKSFIELGKESQWKKNLKDDIEATQWALDKIEQLTIEKEYYKQRYLEFNDYFCERNINNER